MNVGDICNREVVLADCSASLEEAAALMREHGVSTLLVTAATPEGTRVVGILTARELSPERRRPKHPPRCRRTASRVK